MADVGKLFMRLTGTKSGPINGEAEVEEFAKQIELDDWKWELDKSKNNGDPEPSVLKFSKLMDRSTPTMLQAMCSGERMTAVISLVDHGQRGSTGRPIFSLVLTLEQAVVISYNFKARADDASGSIEEDWDLDYETIKIEYRSVLHPGTSQVVLRRPPGSSTDSPGKAQKEILTLAESLGKDDLITVWNQLKQMSENNKYGANKSSGKDAAKTKTS